MARLARVVAPGLPHHITQRSNRRQPAFFEAADYHAYKALLAEWCRRTQVQVWAYCLMTNHVHLILVPATAESLRQAVGEAHRRYTRRIHFREGWRGYLWQGRFASYVLDESYLLAATRYVELNPVRAGLVADPGGYPWSSAAAHLAGQDDGLVQVEPLLQLIPDWQTFLQGGLTTTERARIERHGRTGRPLGSDAFVDALGRQLGRVLVAAKPGPKPRRSVAN